MFYHIQMVRASILRSYLSNNAIIKGDDAASLPHPSPHLEKTTKRLRAPKP